MARRGRKVALVAAATVGLVLASAALQWRPLVVRWYIGHLREERELLLDLCTAAPGSPAHEAVRGFVRTPQGKKRLLEVYLDAVLASGRDVTSDLNVVRTYWAGAWLLLWLQGSEMHVVSFTGHPNSSFHGAGWGVEYWSVQLQHQSHRGRPLVPLLSALQGLLLEVGYDHYPLSRNAELIFSVVTRRDGEEGILGSPTRWDRWTEGRVALIEAVGRQWHREGR